ncbi:hypothetical protein BDV39DRAFT_205980 [Aspergillus sergii]|uniref:Cyanovirin-N domain-containing protein n=1 Tax=Aspergillus sergii TaxID=1034303 RepID=A0A5N6X0H6_9EURO|nr:hypothetical protein BDV39DRAFT_205980 [Aspergillus sergii]
MRPNISILILPLLALSASSDDAKDKIKKHESWWWPNCTEYGVVEKDGTESFFKATCPDGTGNNVTTELDLKPCYDDLLKEKDEFVLNYNFDGFVLNSQNRTYIEKCILRNGPPEQKELGCFVYKDNPDNSNMTQLTWWDKQHVAVEDSVLTCYDHKGERV